MKPKSVFSPPWFGHIDRYIIRKLLVSFFFLFWVIISICIVIDFSDKLEDFLDDDFGASTLDLIWNYYLPFIPWIGAILAPLLVFLSVIFMTSRMAFNTEVVAILSSGSSYNRFLRPYFVSGLLLGGLMFFANHWMVPQANKARIGFERAHIRGLRHYGHNLYLRLDSLQHVNLDQFKYLKGEGLHFTLERYKPGSDGRELIFKLKSRKIYWQPADSSWRITDYDVWEIDGMREKFYKGKEFDTLMNLYPDDFEVDVGLKETLDAAEMKAFLDKERAQGSSNLEEYEVEHERRTSSSIAMVILTLMGASIASRKIRGGMGLHLAFGVGLSAAYIVFLQFSSTFSIKGDLPAWIGVNIPNVVFAIITLILIRRAPK